MNFATPMAYQTNLLVMSAGNYRFAEFVKVGVPLMVLMWLLYDLVTGLALSVACDKRLGEQRELHRS